MVRPTGVEVRRAITLQRENAGFHANLDVLTPDAGKLNGQKKTLRVFSQVGDRHPATDLGTAKIPLLHDVFEKTVKAFLEGDEIPEWIPGCAGQVGVTRADSPGSHR
jgi:hypothetical protein